MVDPSDPAQRFSSDLRLSDAVVPRAYRLALRIDPSQPTASGEVVIEVEINAPTPLVRLHAEGLEIARAQARVADRTIDLAWDQQGSQLVLFTRAEILPVGRAELTLSWTGPMPQTPLGLYRAEDNGRWYTYTQFEPLEARRAFPCFDEPRFKTPYTLTIETPAGLQALGNNPERKSEQPTAGGWTRWEFDPTPPLPTYLLAFAVGDFDFVEGGKVSKGRVPFRVITAKGKGHLAAFALDRIPRHLDWHEDWFGTPYPYDKLDFLAVTSFSSTAMENPGLVTFREARLLIDGDVAAVDDRIWCEAVIAHEIAHMWFGNLVTPSWWDDIWLNEAFATWMARKSVHAVSPELDMFERALRGSYHVMGLDARVHARAVRQPIETDGDIYNAFDWITYRKGAAVLSMIESWIGPERFQAGVRSYLADFAHGTATTADLVAHLARAGERDVASVLASFVDQPGVPLVNFDWRCEPDGVVALDVAQKAFRLLGDPRGADATTTWRLPICGRLSDGKQTVEHCDLLTAPRATWRVNAGFCPSFAHPNVNEAGYYRWLTRTGPVSLAHSDPAAFAGHVQSLMSGVESGEKTLSSLLDGVTPLFDVGVSSSQLYDLITALEMVAELDPAAQDDPRFRAKVKRLLGKIPLDLGLGESPRERKRMTNLVWALGTLARDKRVSRHAKRVSEAFLAELEGRPPRVRVSPEHAAVYLPLYVMSTGTAPRGHTARDRLWQRLRAAFDKAGRPADRDLVIQALASFEEPELVLRTLGLVLDGTLRAQDLRTVRYNLSAHREVVLTVWGWLQDNFDALLERIGAKAAPALPRFAIDLCEEGDAQRIEAFFAGKKDQLPDSIERPLNQTLEAIRSCVARRARYGAEARAWYQ